MRTHLASGAGVMRAVILQVVWAQAQLPRGASPAVTAADIRFMRDMIGHHQQALEMPELVSAHSRTPQLRILAERIAVSQADEIARMRRMLGLR
jgi:uncharacterized protein (DUF305 family)